MKYFKAISLFLWCALLFLWCALLFSVAMEVVMVLLHVPQEVNRSLGFLLGLLFVAWLWQKLIVK